MLHLKLAPLEQSQQTVISVLNIAEYTFMFKYMLHTWSRKKELSSTLKSTTKLEANSKVKQSGLIYWRFIGPPYAQQRWSDSGKFSMF